MPDSTSSPYALISLGQFGERARPGTDQLREAALVVGLGQVGQQAVARVRAMLNVLLARREVQNNIHLLAIARRRSLREEVALPREERLPLEMDAIRWTDIPARYSQMGVPQWWPHSPRAPEAQKDPSLVRAHSRLMLFHHAPLISDTLYRQIQWLHEVGTGRDLKLARRIYVLASLAEAEGSGMLFDIVTRLRLLCGDQPTTIMGIFSLRAAPLASDPENVLAMANVYATLREIDTYTAQPKMYPSRLPVVGHLLPAVSAHPALDMILLADDANAASVEAPENPVAECAVTWIAASLTDPATAPQLPTPLQVNETDRFAGYSTVGVSRLALPTRAAMDLSAVGLAQIILKAAKSTQAASPTAGWINQMMNQAQTALLDIDLLHLPQVSDRLRDWSYALSLAGLTRQLETRVARGETGRMLDLVQSETRRLEKEVSEQDTLEQGVTVTMTDTLRARMDSTLSASQRDLQNALYTAPVELAYQRGYGLIWAVSALEGLEKQVVAALTELERNVLETDALHQNARSALLEAANQHDGKTVKRKTVVVELDARAGEMLNATAAWIAAQARLDGWRGLRRQISDLISQVRDVIPQIEIIGQSLRDFEQSCREAMAQAVRQPPQFPAGVALTEHWYAAGIKDIAEYGLLQPRELLAQVFNVWGGAHVPQERRLGRFLAEALDAARRTLAGAYNFLDLYQFLSENQNNLMFRQALMKLPGAATPALIPNADERHPAPALYELVRETPRAFSALGPVQPGFARSFVPSPDPDEITVLRVLHGMMAEAIPALREGYRRAYDRAGAEGMPLHIDRRWDSTMADLVHTAARREISTIWENLIKALLRDPGSAAPPLDALVRAFGLALDVQETTTVPSLPGDMRLVVYKLRPFRLKLPPPNCAVLFIFSNRSAEAVGEEIERAMALLPLEEQFAFVVNLTGRRDMDELLAPLRRIDFTSLVLTEADIKHIVSARQPTRALGDLVLDQVSLTTVSPFYTRGPVPEHMFFGREREISEVRSKLRTHSVALIGGRRIGKTSTLQRIQRLLKPIESDYVPYYLDCHNATNYQSFFWLVNKRWELDLPANVNPVQFEDAVNALQQRHRGKNIAILFDEVDTLLRFDRLPDHQETLFRTFRALSNEKRCQFVFSGEKWLMSATHDPYSALFNFAQAVRLEPLPPKVVHHLVAEPFEMLNVWIEESDQLIDKIYHISAGHPNIVQMICQAMVEELDHDPQNASLLNMAHLDHATSQRELQDEIVETIWGQMNPLAKLITLIWPEDEVLLTLNQIEALLSDIGIHRVAPEKLERTAKDLELYCFVRPRENDQIELIPIAFPAILDFMTDKKRQIEIVRRQYENESRAAPG
ncbi:MAG: AAA family ATPase [Chloroflexi bacterium]|nr:AAA family ATPase [Chloroflexota bacterium]